MSIQGGHQIKRKSKQCFVFICVFVFNLFHFRHANITVPKMGLLNIGLKSNDLTVNYKNKYVDFHHKRHQFFFKILP